MSRKRFEGRIYFHQSGWRECGTQGRAAQECWQLLQFLAFAGELRMDSRILIARERMAENEFFNRKLPNPHYLRGVDVVVL